MTEHELDTAIDRAVRDLMDVDTDGGFRARVAARLEQPRRRVVTPALLALAGAAAAAVVAFAWTRTPVMTPAVPAPVAVAVAPSPAQTPVSVRRDPPAGAEAVRPRAPRPAGRPQPAAVETIPRDLVVATVAGPSSVPALTELEAIAVQPLVEHAIVPAAIDMAPLAPINELQVAPLEPPQRQ